MINDERNKEKKLKDSLFEIVNSEFWDEISKSKTQIIHPIK